MSQLQHSEEKRCNDLLLLPAYAGLVSIEQALADRRAARLLWLEILVNDQFDWSPWRDEPLVQEAYRKACRWYTTYRSLLTSLLPRVVLPSDAGPIDPREYRTFVEAIRFAAAQS